ncbi:MAG: hypothetical protein IJD45_06030 [Clostridia bacterium]|nr:hypothetical protein [Clostridia bacterium]
MIKALKIFLTFALIISVIALMAGCKSEQPVSSENEESSLATDSIETSLITNNSGSSNSQNTTTSEASSTYSSSEEHIEEYHSRPDFSDYNSDIAGVSSDVVASTESATSKNESTTDTTSNTSQISYAKKAVSALLDAIKEGDFETAQNSLTGERPPQESLGFDNATIEKIKNIFSELDYKIVSAKRTDATKATVTVKITALNFKKVYRNYVKASSEIATNSPDLTPQEIAKKIDKAFKDALKEGKKKPIEKTVKLSVVGHGKEWQPEYSEDFAKACLGGISQVADALK